MPHLVSRPIVSHVLRSPRVVSFMVTAVQGSGTFGLVGPTMLAVNVDR